jgi:hypothetical protein
MALTEQQKDECERHLLYPSSGASAGGLGPPFFAEFSTAAGMLGFPTDPANVGLRFRLNNLPTDIEVKVVGPDHQAFDSYLAFAGVDLAIVIPGSITVGDPVVVQIGKQPISYALQGGDTAPSVAAVLASSITEDTVVGPKFIAIASSATVKVRAREWGNRPNAVSVAVFTGDSIELAVYQPGTTTPTARMYGGNDPPGPVFRNHEDPELTYPIYGYLPWCRYWENKLGLAAEGMDTIQADIFKQQPNEYQKRKAAYIDACRDLAQALGIQYAGGGRFDGRGPMRRIT